MIVKDGAATLKRCLSSVRRYVDEVCVYDTGSTDGTLELLEQLAEEPGPPIRVERGEWRDDFAWAREQSFAMASPEHEWLMWLDADDELRGGEYARRLAAEAADRGNDSVVALLDAADDPDEPGSALTTWQDRIMRRGGGEWRGAVHEVFVFPRLDPGLILVANPSAFYVYHQKRSNRFDRHLDAMKQAATDIQTTPHALYCLGAYHLFADAFADATPSEKWSNAAEAARLFERFIAEGFDLQFGKWSSLFVQAYDFAADAHDVIGNKIRADELRAAGRRYASEWLQAADRGEAFDPGFAQTLEEIAAQWERAGRPTESDSLAFNLAPQPKEVSAP
jgi:hypothetical protein